MLRRGENWIPAHMNIRSSGERAGREIWYSPARTKPAIKSSTNEDFILVLTLDGECNIFLSTLSSSSPPSCHDLFRYYWTLYPSITPARLTFTRYCYLGRDAKEPIPSWDSNVAYYVPFVTSGAVDERRSKCSERGPISTNGARLDLGDARRPNGGIFGTRSEQTDWTSLPSRTRTLKV